jgi:hypothetical protein
MGKGFECRDTRRERVAEGYCTPEGRRGIKSGARSGGGSHQHDSPRHTRDTTNSPAPISGPRLGLVLTVHRCGCSVCSGDRKILPNTPIIPHETPGSFATTKPQPRSTHAHLCKIAQQSECRLPHIRGLHAHARQKQAWQRRRRHQRLQALPEALCQSRNKVQSTDEKVPVRRIRFPL